MINPKSFSTSHIFPQTASMVSLSRFEVYGFACETQQSYEVTGLTPFCVVATLGSGCSYRFLWRAGKGFVLSTIETSRQVKSLSGYEPEFFFEWREGGKTGWKSMNIKVFWKPLWVTKNKANQEPITWLGGTSLYCHVNVHLWVPFLSLMRCVLWMVLWWFVNGHGY